MKRLYLFCLLLALGLAACQPIQPQGAMPQQGVAPSLSDGDKIAAAMSAATMSIAADATIIDWPADPATGPGAALRAGTNGWVCRPDSPNSPDPDPRCFDANWLTLFGLELGPEREALNIIGVGYMLQGDSVADNDDPTAQQPPDGGAWLANAPHVMVVAPQPLDQAIYTTDRNSGGPWVMWAGTPVEHLMVPVETTVRQDPADKIADAMSSATMLIAADATIIDWPAVPVAGPGEELRAGTNGWVCLPDNPNSPDPDPRCFDKNWRTLIGMEFGPEREALNMIGIGYMLQGDSVADNDDPTAQQPPNGGAWLANAPHVMFVSSIPWDLSFFTTDRNSGGPWVMWAGTPAEHLMVPVTEPNAAEASTADAATAVEYLTAAGSHGPEWHLRGSQAKIIGGYGKENWGNLAYSGQGVVAVDGQAEAQVNTERDAGTMVATFNGTIRPTKDQEFTGEIRLEFNVFGGEDAPAWREGGGADFIMIHGATGQEAPLVPAVDCYLCTWGAGKLFVDGELVHEALGHFMWTPIIRDENQVVWADEARTASYTPMEPDKGIIARPTESQLHFVFFDPRVPDPDNYPPMGWFLKVNFDQVEDLSATDGE